MSLLIYYALDEPIVPPQDISLGRVRVRTRVALAALSAAVALPMAAPARARTRAPAPATAANAATSEPRVRLKPTIRAAPLTAAVSTTMARASRRVTAPAPALGAISAIVVPLARLHVAWAEAVVVRGIPLGPTLLLPPRAVVAMPLYDAQVLDARVSPVIVNVECDALITSPHYIAYVHPSDAGEVER